jgi:hypothetical protein
MLLTPATHTATLIYIFTTLFVSRSAMLVKFESMSVRR